MTRFWQTTREGARDAFAAASADDPSATGLGCRDIAAFYRLFAGTARTVTVFSQGVNQSTSGTDKVNAILNCHLATGRIGKPGTGPLSVTGQPNAMGGRETGGLANMLAAHLDLEDAQHRSAVKSFWSAPKIASSPGLKAVDMFKAVGDGRIKAIWIACTNPAVSMPDADAVRDAISACDSCGRVRHHGQNGHCQTGRCPAACDGMGGKGRHGHELGPDDQSSATRPARAG